MRRPDSQSSSNDRCQRRARLAMCMVLALVMTMPGCQIDRERVARRAVVIANLGCNKTVKVSPVKRPRRVGPIRRLLHRSTPPSDRTARLLRTYNLEPALRKDPDAVISWLQTLVREQPRMEEIHALAEIAKTEADWAARSGDKPRATKLYATAMMHAHQFLFEPNLNLQRNAYDPQFRNICDIYNESLAELLRQVCEEGRLVPGHQFEIGEGDFVLVVEVQMEGRWHDQAFERFELVSDFETEGMQNEYHTYGLGVPLIAVRDISESPTVDEKYYPPSLTLPMTAFFELVREDVEISFDENTTQRRRAVLRLFDPLEQQTLHTHNVTVPLESDITTPIAYHLNDPLLNTGLLATAALVNAQLGENIHGMYMLEPFDPDKIPVVMVHGLWSSPVTWAQMYNDLRSVKELRNNYQFWFYSYATGQPFLYSAGKMRDDLAKLRRDLDPEGTSQTMEQMVLVGHSMGGLVSQLQTIDSEDRFWKILSDSDARELEGDEESIAALKKTYFFEPDLGIDRVMMIGTPNHGSEVAGATARWVSQRVFTLPTTLTNDFLNLAETNQKIFGDASLLTSTTSIDDLAAGGKVFEAMDECRRSPLVTFHNIIGKIPQKGLLARTGLRTGPDSDGVVTVESARTKFSSSESFIPAPHSEIHQHPQCILEVREILLDNLVEKHRIRDRSIPQIPAIQIKQVAAELEVEPEAAEIQLQ